MKLITLVIDGNLYVLRENKVFSQLSPGGYLYVDVIEIRETKMRDTSRIKIGRKTYKLTSGVNGDPCCSYVKVEEVKQ